MPAFVGVSSFRPLLELLEEDMFTVLEGFGCYHCSVIVGPAMYFGI
jgi:hypothetical protein